MALIPQDTYPAGTIATDADYPHGKARNVSGENATDGFPWDKDYINDLLGLQQAILREAGIVPSGMPDTALDSQYLQGIRALITALGFSRTEIDGFIDSKIAGVVDGAPGPLNTLNKLAAAVAERFTTSQSDTRYGVHQLEVTRPADVANIPTRTVTALGEITVSRQGYWLFQITTGYDIVGFPDDIRLTFDGVEYGLITHEERDDVYRVFSKAVHKGLGDTVEASLYNHTNSVRYLESTFEAIYLGPRV